MVAIEIEIADTAEPADTAELVDTAEPADTAELADADAETAEINKKSYPTLLESMKPE